MSDKKLPAVSINVFFNQDDIEHLRGYIIQYLKEEGEKLVKSQNTEKGNKAVHFGEKVRIGDVPEEKINEVLAALKDNKIINADNGINIPLPLE